ncbi:hypothetical protein RJT34_24176 [Clitoria ternatea]|uniref:DUF4378 domain-containing protein n=1 Tax=Clitoria ternatea TaxID=43366 RepID=A0AAN9IL73_CLITE
MGNPLHVIKYHHWRHVKRRLTHKKNSGGRHDPTSEFPGTSDETCTALANVEEKPAQSTTPPKHSIKSKIRSLLHEDRKKGRHKRSSTCPAKPQKNHAETVHHLEVDPLSELLLTVESPEPVLQTFKNHLGTLDVPSKKTVANNNSDKCVDCGTIFSSDTTLHENNIHKHLSCRNQGVSEEKLMNAKILTTDASPHLFKDFLDALEVINTNKDFLLRYIHDPGSPLPFHIQNQPSLGSNKSRRAKSISFPVSDASSESKDSEQGHLINQMVDEWFNEKGERHAQSQVQSRRSSEDFDQQSISSSSSNTKFDQFHTQNQEWNGRDHTSSSVPPRVPNLNQVKTRHFGDLRRKMKEIIEEGKNEKNRITMDAILDKIPRGKRITKNVKKLINDHSKDPSTQTEGDEESATSGFGRRLSSNSFNKRHASPMRTSSLKESAGRYSQLYNTCFNAEAKYPKTENLKLKAQERNSVLKTPKSFKRFLSLPNLKSYFHQNEEPPVVYLSPQNSMRKYGDRTIGSSFIDQRRFDHGDDSKIQILPPALSDNTNQEISLNADRKQLLVRSASKSGLDFVHEAKSDKGIGTDGLDYLRDSEQDIGNETDSTTMPIEANSVFSSDTSFLDVTFDLEDSDSESRPESVDGLDDMVEKQDAEVHHPEEFETYQRSDSLSKKFNHEIPFIEVDPSNEAAFNYVKKVLELSGFTGHESFGIWYSDNQPVDPSVYEELEGCLLLDPSCSGNNSDEGGECDHQLLFDIINEGLLEIFGRSYNYYPRPLSSLSRVHPLPEGDNVLLKVWTLISWYLNSTTTSELYPSLDYYVSKDLAKYDGWMNLQFDSECVGLELDDLIFDDLLEEITCS